MAHNTIQEMKEIINAIGDGKRVQFQQIGTDEWSDYDHDTPNFFSFRYRIKPEKKWRPFNDVDEFIKAAGGLGAIWLKSKCNGRLESVNVIDAADKSKPIYLYEWESFNTLFEDYTFADGTPCGIEEGA